MDTKKITFLILFLIPVVTFSQEFTTKSKTSIFPKRRMTMKIATGTRVLTDTCALPVPVFVVPQSNSLPKDNSLSAQRLVQSISDSSENQYFVSPDTLNRIDDSLLVFKNTDSGDSSQNSPQDSLYPPALTVPATQRYTKTN